MVCQIRRGAKEASRPQAGIPNTAEAESAKDKGTRSQGTNSQVREEPCHLIVQITLTLNRYQGYNKDLIDRFVSMGFDLDRVVEAFNFVGIDWNDGQDYELEDAYMGDITA